MGYHELARYSVLKFIKRPGASLVTRSLIPKSLGSIFCVLWKLIRLNLRDLVVAKVNGKYSRGQTYGVFDFRYH